MQTSSLPEHIPAHRYLQHKLVGLAQLAGVLLVALEALDFLPVRGVQQELLDVGRFQAVRLHRHEDLAQLDVRELEVGYQDGWGGREVRHLGGEEDRTPGGKAVPRTVTAWQDRTRRLSSISPRCESGVDSSMCPQWHSVSPGERKGFLLSEAARGPQGVTLILQPPPGYCIIVHVHHQHIRLGCTGNHPQHLLLLSHVPCGQETRGSQGPTKPSHPPS